VMALDSLRRKRIIEVEKAVGKHGKRNTYRFLVDAQEVAAGATDAPQEVQGLHPKGGELSTTGATDAPQEVQGLHPKGGELSTTGATDAPQEVQGLHLTRATDAPKRYIKDNNKNVCVSRVRVGAREGGSFAMNGLGDVPAGYVAWRFADLERTGWTLADGRKVAPDGFVAHVLAWWRNERDRARWFPDGSTAAKSAAVADWTLCAERCAHCGEVGGCACGVTVPPAMDRKRPHPPEECPKFAPKVEARGGAA
jgi:hypothetical protein